MPSLVAVTVNWRRPDLTERCVNSLRNGSLVPDRIIVVDNGSGDGSVERIRSSCPGVSLLALQENTGFTGGYNAGMREALAGGAGLVFIINNDAEVEPDTMKLLVDAAAADSDAGFFGPAQRLPDGSSAGPFMQFRWLDGRVSVRDGAGIGGRSGWESFLSGCAVLVRGDALEQVGLLDDRYFLYGEDVEWSFRARRKGVGLRSVNGAVVRHELFASSGRESPVFLYYNARNRFLLARYAPPALRVGVYHANVMARMTGKARRLAARGNREGAEALIAGMAAGLFLRKFGGERVAAPRWLVRAVLGGAR